MRYIIAYILYFLSNSSYPVDAPPIDPKQILCVATAVYHEARGESLTGQAAVAYTIQHRTRSKDFPKTACEVVYQKKPVQQFTDIDKARPDYSSKEWKLAVKVSVLAWTGYIHDPTKGAMYYYNPKKAAKPGWARMEVLAVIGNHIFWQVAKA